MNIGNLVVEGENIRRISDVLYNQKDETNIGKPHIYSHGDIIILMRESYYERISSTLMSVIIMKFIDDNKVEIELVVSGGKDGLLMLSWGAEKSENRDVVNEIMRACKINSWKITSMEPKDIAETLTESTINKIKEKIGNYFKK
ncbi:hypothetical protein G9F72_010410 [Clostridium estertheticum]|uniref:hypothetical protein n=1 Tax=Clostridium estertheticum TaxID=238834 RepID=UPI0013E93580|nr:hypothetical protein [Clostridium estertheticum]MBZ9686737.1 hypothetical protein [Clostridium estertheticum]